MDVTMQPFLAHGKTRFHSVTPTLTCNILIYKGRHSLPQDEMPPPLYPIACMLDMDTSTYIHRGVFKVKTCKLREDDQRNDTLCRHEHEWTLGTCVIRLWTDHTILNSPTLQQHPLSLMICDGVECNLS